MNQENQLEQAMYVLETYKRQIENLSRQRQMVMASLEEHMRARLTLSEGSKQVEGHEMLVPVGANTFMYAKSHKPDKVLIGIGSDVVIEDTSQGAMEKLDHSVRMLEEADKRIAVRIAEIEKQAIALNAQIEAAVEQAQRQQGAHVHGPGCNHGD